MKDFTPPDCACQIEDRIFSSGCPLCRHASDVIEVGKCRGCSQIVLEVNQSIEEAARLMLSAVFVQGLPSGG